MLAGVAGRSSLAYDANCYQITARHTPHTFICYLEDTKKPPRPTIPPASTARSTPTLLPPTASPTLLPTLSHTLTCVGQHAHGVSWPFAPPHATAVLRRQCYTHTIFTHTSSTLSHTFTCVGQHAHGVNWPFAPPHGTAVLRCQRHESNRTRAAADRQRGLQPQGCHASNLVAAFELELGQRLDRVQPRLGGAIGERPGLQQTALRFKKQMQTV